MTSDDWLPKSIQCLKGYTWQKFLSDLVAGITVGLVALPLAMAFSIASGVSPQVRFYTAIIAGFLISALGGSSTQIGGPSRKHPVDCVRIRRVGDLGCIASRIGGRR
jgi:sulfate permease, SulP family